MGQNHPAPVDMSGKMLGDVIEQILCDYPVPLCPVCKEDVTKPDPLPCEWCNDSTLAEKDAVTFAAARVVAYQPRSC